jgi:membrane protease subunit (stomatin/prohibitin family)
MRDPELELRVNPRVFGTYSFRVADPTRFVIEFWRQRGGDSDAALQWVRDQIVMGVKTTLTRLIKSGDLTMMDLGTAGPDIARAIVQSSPDLAGIGVQLLEIAKLNINLSDEDQARIDEFQDQIVQAKVEARKAKITIARAEAEAQARKYALDQDFENRMRYVNQMDMGRYQQYAGAEATLGLGEGLAEGGGGSAGAAGAQMMAGMGLAAGLAAGARPLGQAPYPAGGYVPVSGLASAAVPGSPVPIAAGQNAGPPVGAAASPGVARAPSFCSNCGTPASGKFCSNCGQPFGG